MKVRRNQSTIVFHEVYNKATYATPDQVHEVHDFDFTAFPGMWEYDQVNNKFFEIHPEEGWYMLTAITEEQTAALDSLVEAFEEIKDVEGVTGDEW